MFVLELGEEKGWRSPEAVIAAVIAGILAAVLAAILVSILRNWQSLPII